MRAILIAARRILVRDGVDAARIVDVAELAGVSPGSLYQYFPSFESVVATIHVELLEGAVAELAEELARCDDASLPEVARAITIGPLRVARAHVELLPALEEASARFGTERRLAPILERERALLRVFFDSRSDLAGVDTKRAAFMVSSTVHGLVTTMAREFPERLRDDATSTDLERMVLGYLQAA
ncbi:MAG: TetR/AcrR family transcriptional regulator [Myxococcota bacterium]